MFKFRLANILRLRDYKEKFCLEEVGRCAFHLNQAVRRKKEMKNKIALLEQDFACILKGLISPEEASLYRNYLTYQHKLLELQEEAIIEKKQALEAAQQKLLHAMKERKVLDKLKDKQYIRYEGEQQKTEQLFQDELAVTTRRR